MAQPPTTEFAVRAMHLWLNYRLGRHGLHCYDFASDLSDGVLLLHLIHAEEAEVPSKPLGVGSLARPVPVALPGARAENVRGLLDFLEAQGVFCGALQLMIDDIVGDAADGTSGGAREVDSRLLAQIPASSTYASDPQQTQK
jgi:hypothetical protein